ncbi:MAG TPA: PAS domain S-box protein, partial [Acidimicrobiia bacterium]|nr:PAS domain S-box protein [Acidimicrobiia bacterium]
MREESDRRPPDAGGRSAVGRLVTADARAERLASVVRSSNDAICAKNLDGIVLDWNPAAERIYGWSAAEIVGRPLALVVPPDRLE